MVEKGVRCKQLIIISIVILLTAPVFSLGADVAGLDWYCSEPETHSDTYKKHLKLHIAHGAEKIAAKLDKIYNNQSLTSEEKQEKTVEILNKYLAHAKAGIGD